MFVTINTNGAHTIVITIPNEGADKSLPALARMLENNAVFIGSEGWRENKIVEPEMTIHLGDMYTLKRKDDEIAFVEHKDSAVISDEWVPVTPEVFASNRAEIEKLEQKAKNMQEEIAAIKFQLERANAELQELKENE